MKWYLNQISLSLNRHSLKTQSLASCRITLWNFKVLSNTFKGSIQASILFNFQGPVRRPPSSGQLIYFTTPSALLSRPFLWVCKKTFRGERPSGLGRGVRICIIAILFLVVNGFLKKFFGFCLILAPARPKADRSGPPRPQAGPFQCYIIHYNCGRFWAGRRLAAAGMGKKFPSFFKKGFSFGDDCGMIIYTFGRYGCPLCGRAA